MQEHAGLRSSWRSRFSGPGGRGWSGIGGEEEGRGFSSGTGGAAQEHLSTHLPLAFPVLESPFYPTVLGIL